MTVSGSRLNFIIALKLEEVYCPLLAPFMILMGTWPLLHSEVNTFFIRCAKTSWIGIALFQSIYTRSGKSGGEKSYGVLYTCMRSRSVHLETANSLESSSFINALRHFMNQRGAVRQLRSDQGTNLIGARSEQNAALCERNQDRVQDYLLRNGCEWIPFKLNVPHSSHMGGT